jgi:hypothetical protein
LLGGTYADLKTADPVSELSIWLRACIIASPDLLRMLLTSGCSVAETYVEAPASTNVEGYKSGWNCLFFLVLHASRPRTSTEFEGLQVLLGAGADPSLRDAEGYTISDYVDDDKGSKFASYRRELWYTALRRAHIQLDHLTIGATGIQLEIYSGTLSRSTLSRVMVKGQHPKASRQATRGSSLVGRGSRSTFACPEFEGEDE